MVAVLRERVNRLIERLADAARTDALTGAPEPARLPGADGGRDRACAAELAAAVDRRRRPRPLQAPERPLRPRRRRSRAAALRRDRLVGEQADRRGRPDR